MTDKETIPGKVIEALPNLEFKVELGDRTVRCYLSGKMRLHRIKVLIGDRVSIVFPPGSSVGRIVRRD